MTFDSARFFETEFAEHQAVAAATRDSLAPAYDSMLALWIAAVRGGGKILFFGNGGSAGDAQHLATELTIRYRQNRAPIAALALSTDSSALTAAGNDMGFDQVFARQLAALGRPGDVAVGITTSGRSPNVIEALKTARAMGIHATALTGNGGGSLHGLAEPMLVVPSSVTARIQEMHITLGQMLCAGLELALGLVTP